MSNRTYRSTLQEAPRLANAILTEQISPVIKTVLLNSKVKLKCSEPDVGVWVGVSRGVSVEEGEGRVVNEGRADGVGVIVALVTGVGDDEGVIVGEK
jgi:hypothetical protein